MVKAILAILSIVSIFYTPDCSGPAGVTVTEAWAQMTPNDDTPAALYFNIKNPTDDGDILTSVTTTMTDQVQIFQLSPADNGINELHEVSSLEVPAKKDLRFKPHTLFVGLSNLKESVAPGQTFPVTLTFSKAGTIHATANVESESASGYVKKD